MGKTFLLNPHVGTSDKKIIKQLEKDKQRVRLISSKSNGILNKEILEETSDLKYVDGRVIIKIDVEAKNWHTFDDGTKLRRERQYNEFNRRLAQPVNAIVVSGKDIPMGAEILIHPNAIHETYQILNYKKLSGKTESADVKYYSIREDECFLWKEGEKWQPLYPFATALRVFRPYQGFIEDIPPTKIKDVLYVTSGELEGKVVKTIDHCDYEIIFQDSNGREARVIRFRPFGDARNGREEEAIAIMEELTEKVRDNKLLTGMSIADAK